MHRCSLEQTTSGGLALCRGHHEKHDACQWEYFVPVAREAELVKALDEAMEATEYYPLHPSMKRWMDVAHPELTQPEG